MAEERIITYRDALNEALREEMRRDPTIILLGEDIGKYWNGAFKVTGGLADEFGEERVRDTPISENAIVGCGVGLALTGFRPVCEIMFGDLITLAMDQIVNQAAKSRFMFGGQSSVPLIVRTPFGAGGSYAGHHSSSYEAWFMHVPGLRIAVPSTPYDAKGLLKTALRMKDPVMFFEQKFLYNSKGHVPEEEYTVPFGKADVKRQGDDVTIVATSKMVLTALEAAQALEKDGISVEVVDPRTLNPLDEDTIVKSVQKTSRLVVVHESADRGGISGEIIKVAIKGAFYYLDAPPVTVAGKNCHLAFAPVLEQFGSPSVNDIIDAVKGIV
ncbi:MAG TPA: alpha-ketoacid dehydrogenase subunit beta [Candidatus Lokiarchaeia archaeon]|nr:alpha-ketoacid dehydrogenase subunit beta [Candidatus Lokiarchaeia archaeon]